MTPELENMVTILALQAAKRLGYDPEDMLQEARIIALHAERTHDPSLGPLGARIRFLVARRLPDQIYWRLRGCVKDHNREPSDLCLGTLKDRPHSTNFVTDLLDELSEDAAAIVRIVLDTPGFVFRDEHASRRDEREFLATYLERNGWEADKIQPAFAEIEAALA